MSKYCLKKEHRATLGTSDSLHDHVWYILVWTSSRSVTTSRLILQRQAGVHLFPAPGTCYLVKVQIVVID